MEERGAFPGTTRSGRAPRPSEPTVQMPMRPLLSKPMKATRRPSGENDGCVAKTDVTNGRMRVPSARIVQSAVRPFVSRV